MEKLTLESINEIRKLTQKTDRNYLNYVSELETLLETQPSGDWFKKPTNDVVVGEIWEYSIGTIEYPKRKHIFACMYIPESGIAVKKHGHDQLINNGKNVKKTSELYIFYVPGQFVDMRFCTKNDVHELRNTYGCPVYVISAKATGRG